MPGLPDVGGLPSRQKEKGILFLWESGEERISMPKDRVKQRAHLKCGMTKGERLRSGASGGLGDGLDRKNYYGLPDPTPYKAIRNMIKRGGRL